jgi:hypothetical protein
MPVWFEIALGAALLTFTWTSVVFTLILPRSRLGPGQLALWINRGCRRVFRAVARLAPTYEGKDSVLALTGPVAVLAELLAWLVLLLIAFTIMLEPYTHDIGDAVTEVGAAMFTLGLARSARFTNDTIVIFAAASGFIVIALQIAYLPSLYAAFNRRESLITMLASRAGEPSWGPEILIRHQLVDIVDALPDFYDEWETWAADFSESHSTYPVLLLFRSPDPWSSWVTSLLSVLDAPRQPALNPKHGAVAGPPVVAHGLPRCTASPDALGWTYDPDLMPDGPVRLTFDESAAAVSLLQDVGFPTERDAATAWPHFRGWR